MLTVIKQDSAVEANNGRIVCAARGTIVYNPFWGGRA